MRACISLQNLIGLRAYGKKDKKGRQFCDIEVLEKIFTPILTQNYQKQRS